VATDFRTVARRLAVQSVRSLSSHSSRGRSTTKLAAHAGNHLHPALRLNGASAAGIGFLVVTSTIVRSQDVAALWGWRGTANFDRSTTQDAAAGACMTRRASGQTPPDAKSVHYCIRLIPIPRIIAVSTKSVWRASCAGAQNQARTWIRAWWPFRSAHSVISGLRPEVPGAGCHWQWVKMAPPPWAAGPGWRVHWRGRVGGRR